VIKYNISVRLLMLLFCLQFTNSVFAAPNSFVYEGVLMDSNGNPVGAGAAVTKDFSIDLKINNVTALTQTFTAVSVLEGNFKLTIDGLGAGSAYVGYSSLQEIIAAAGNKTLQVSVQGESFADIAIDSVPYAMEAGSLANNASISTSGTVSTSNAFRAYNGSTNFVELKAPVLTGPTLFQFPNSNGTSGQVLKTDGNGVTSWGSIAATDVTGAVSVANGGTGATTATVALNNLLPAQAGNTGKFLTTDGAGVVTWGTAGGAPGDASYASKGIVQFDSNAATSGISITTGVAKLSNTGVTANNYGSASQVGQFTVDAQGRITAASNVNINDSSKLPLAGGTMTGDLNMDGNNIINSGAISSGATAHASAIADFASTTKGILIPRMSEANRNTIVSPATGLQIYNTDDNQLNYYNGSAWIEPSNVPGNDTVTSAAILDGTITIADLAASNYTTTAENNKLLMLSGTGIGTVKGIGIVGGGTNRVDFFAAGTGSNYSLTFPSNQGGNGQILSNNGSGILSWVNHLNSDPNQNTKLGTAALSNITIGVNNTSIGYSSGSQLTSGSLNTFLGNNAGNSVTTGNSNIMIGNTVNPPSGTDSNKLNIGNLIYGDMASYRVGINVQNPTSQFETGATATGSATTTAVKMSLNSTALSTSPTNTTLFAQNVIGTGTTSGGDNRALSAFVQNNSIGGIAKSTGLTSLVQNSNSGSITNAYGLSIDFSAPSGSIANAYGIFTLVTGPNVTNGYGLYINTINATNKYGIWQQDSTAKNFFGGNLGIGISPTNHHLEIQPGTTTKAPIRIHPGGAELTTVEEGALEFSSGVLKFSPDFLVRREIALVSPSTFNPSATFNFLHNNVMHTSSSCGSFNLHNLKDGKSYTLVVQGLTSQMCSFSPYSDAGTTLLILKMPQDHDVTIAGKETVYTFAVVGNKVYVGWNPGY
jgi:hypothetical protein